MAKKAERGLVLPGTKPITELKKELRRAVEALAEEDEDDYNLEATDIAIQSLSALKELKMNRNDEEFVKIENPDSREPPPEFKCPISGILMKDPVVVASGQTYEEQFIQQWLKDGNRNCPQTDERLPHTLLIPNQSLRKMIKSWCTLHKLDIPRTSVSDDEEYTADTNKEHLVGLLERLSSPSISDQKQAAKELRLLTNRSPSFRALLGDTKDVISQIFRPNLIENAYSDIDVHNDLVAMVVNISAHESKAREIAGWAPESISFLIKSLSSKNIETRSRAAAAFSLLSAVDDSNKLIIGETGAIRPMIDLIKEGHPLALKEATLTILSLCTVIENRERAVSEGAAIVVIDKIIGRILLDEMLEILALFCSHQRAIEEIDEHGMVYWLLNILGEEISEENKERCVAIVYAVCFGDRRRLRKINEVENAHETLRRVARSGTSRARRKANGILERMNRFAFASHTA